MLLAGKPSLIVPMRAIAKSRKRTGPLSFEPIFVKSAGGNPGERLEALNSAYNEIQQALAADWTPPTAATQQFHGSAKTLSNEFALSTGATNPLKEIASQSRHLHLMDLKDVRAAFKPNNHALVAPTAQVRGDTSKSSLTHFSFPKVPGGGEDWIQGTGSRGTLLWSTRT